MTLFQIVGAPVAALFAALSAYHLARGDRPRWLLLLRTLVLLAAAVAILQPELTNRIAHVFGIGRGADLMVYLMAVGVIGAFFYFYQKTRQLEGEITSLVRHLALERATKSPDEPTESR
jgi:small membrane protein